MADVDLISLPEIAELAGVRRPVVTTWRRRYPAFPAPARSDRERPLFRATEVVDWLVGTGRAERRIIEPDLRLHLLSCLASQAGTAPGTATQRTLTPPQLVGAVTALICLHHLDDEPLRPDDLSDRHVVEALRERAAEVDWDDEMLRTEIDAIPPAAAWLARVVDELIEAAWGAARAYERVLATRHRLGVPQLYAEALTPPLARLVAGLCGAREQADSHGFVQVADAYAGAGDLLMAVRDTLGEHDTPTMFAAEADPFLARLTRRRLVVHDVPRGTWRLDVAPDLPAGTPACDAVLLRLPYQPAEARAVADPFGALAEVARALAPGQTAVVLGPAELLVGALPPYRPVARTRNELLGTGRVEAIVQLPGGVVPFRPGYQTALWVLRHEESPQWRGRVLLADISDRPLTERVVEELITDVVTWRRAGHHPDQHLRAYASQVLVEELTAPRRPLTARRPSTPSDLLRDGRVAVAEATETEVALDRLAAPRPLLRTHLAAYEESRRVPTRSVAALVRDGHLAVLRGTRLTAGDISGHGHHPVVGSPELALDLAVGSRRIDRAVFAERYPSARLTEAGDVLVAVTPRLRAHHDEAGASVAAYPTRIIRIRPDGRARFTPRVLAALLNAVPGHRPAGAVRAAARLTDLHLPLLPPADVARLDALLAAMEQRRHLARRELALLDDLGRRVVAGLTDGTLTLTAGTPLTGPPIGE